jgi:hypothetical protein
MGYMNLLDAIRKAKIGDILENSKLKVLVEWNGSIWDIPQDVYNLKYNGWSVIDYIASFDGVKG